MASLLVTRALLLVTKQLFLEPFLPLFLLIFFAHFCFSFREWFPFLFFPAVPKLGSMILDSSSLLFMWNTPARVKSMITRRSVERPTSSTRTPTEPIADAFAKVLASTFDRLWRGAKNLSFSRLFFQTFLKPWPPTYNLLRVAMASK